MALTQRTRRLLEQILSEDDEYTQGKDSPRDWGGGNPMRPMDDAEVSAILCAVKGCGRRGWAQQMLASDGGVYRPICAEHSLRIEYLLMRFQGNPDAHANWVQRCAVVSAEVGLGAQGVLGVAAWPASVVSPPSEWLCSECGGGMTGTSGTGHWLHRCKEDRDERGQQDAQQ